jgi:hypothetical protein
MKDAPLECQYHMFDRLWFALPKQAKPDQHIAIDVTTFPATTIRGHLTVERVIL